MAIRQMLMLELSDIVGPENVDDMTKWGLLGFDEIVIFFPFRMQMIFERS